MTKSKTNNQTATNIFSVEEFTTVTVQAIEHFKECIQEGIDSGNSSLEEDPTDLLLIDDPMDLFDYLMNHDYWVRQWSIYLLRQMMGLIYEDSTVTD